MQRAVSPSTAPLLLPGALAILVVAFGTMSGRGDIVHLTNGRSIEGKVETDSEKGTVTITRPGGVAVVTVRGDEVRRIERTRLPEDTFDERLARLDDGDLDGLVRLATWAREKRLRSRLARTCRRILAIDPHHELARKELGYVVLDNVWVLESELARQKSERGLVKFRGEWMQSAERDRRLREEAERKIVDLMASVASTNRYVQEYAVRELMALREPIHRDLIVAYLDDPREMARIVAASAMAHFPAPAGDAGARKITGRLFRRLIGSGISSAELRAIEIALRGFQPAESFRLGLQRLRSSREPREVRRASEVVYQTLRKEWVPDLCRAVAEGKGADRRENAAVRGVLRRALGVDLGGDPDAWAAWWERNRSRFRDEP